MLTHIISLSCFASPSVSLSEQFPLVVVVHTKYRHQPTHRLPKCFQKLFVVNSFKKQNKTNRSNLLCQVFRTDLMCTVFVCSKDTVKMDGSLCTPGLPVIVLNCISNRATVNDSSLLCVSRKWWLFKGPSSKGSGPCIVRWVPLRMVAEVSSGLSVPLCLFLCRRQRN